MRSLVLVAASLGVVATAFAQGHQGGYSLGGYGNVVFPGLGHAPVTPPGGINGPHYPASAFGARPVGPIGPAAPAAHPQHRRTTIVPYPVFVGGYGYGYGYGYDPSSVDPSAYYGGDQQPPVVNPNGAPSVVINQNFAPQAANPVVKEYTPDSWNDQQQQQGGLRMYQAPSGPHTATAQQPSDQPTLYLIAFKDHSIVQALGYWMEGSTLHYVSAEHSLNQASLDLIDRDLSTRLNSERGVEFRIPAAPK